VASTCEIATPVFTFSLGSHGACRASEAEGSGNASWQEEELASGPTDLEASYTGDVQGPINKEPWEKLNPNAKPIESGIRKL